MVVAARVGEHIAFLLGGQAVAVSGMAQLTTRRTTSFSLARSSGVPRSS
jgi:hypothetical protein